MNEINMFDLLGINPLGINPIKNLNSPTRKVANMINVLPKDLAKTLYGNPDRNSLYTRIEIPKNSSPKDNPKMRVLNIPAPRLKTIQRTTYEYLSRVFEPTRYAKGFVANESILSNAWPHRRKAVVIKFDIKDFFPSITFPRVRGMFMSWPFNFSQDIATVFTQICSMDKGAIAQGAPTSPYISNMICRRLDKRISNFAFKNHLTYTRYADDITLSSNKSNLAIKNIQAKIIEIIKEEHFAINEEKLRVLFPSQRQLVTGIVTNDGVNVPRKYIRQIRSLLYQCEKWSVPSTAFNYLQNPLEKGPCLALTQNQGETFVEKDGRKMIKLVYSKYPTIEAPNPKPIGYMPLLMMFLAHLRGRIMYIGQVSKANIDLSFNNGIESVPNDQDKNLLAYQRRYKIYRRFLDRFNAIVEKEEYSREFAIKVRSKKSDYMDQEEQTFFLQKSIEDLRAEIESRSNPEPRYFYSFMSNTLEDEIRAKLAKLIRRHQPDTNTTRYILDSTKDTGSFIMRLLHNESISKSEFDEFMDKYLLIKDRLPLRLEISLTQLLKKVGHHFSSLKKTEYNFFKDDDFRTKELIPFKNNTRFVVNPNKSNGGTDLYQLVSKILRDKYIKAEMKKKNITIIIPENKVDWRTDLYTHVDSVEWALRRIIESIATNSLDTKFHFSIETKEDGRNIFSISNEDTNPVDVPPDRSFLHGKLRAAMSYLDGLAHYSIEANFLGHGPLSLNLYTNEATPIESVTGFTHKLEF
jgi:retron-type reverse transcriptase